MRESKNSTQRLANRTRLLWVAAVSGGVAAIASVSVAVRLWTIRATCAPSAETNGAATIADSPRAPSSAASQTAVAAGDGAVAPAVDASDAVPRPETLDAIPYLGQSVGYPASGSLFDGIQLPPGEGYIVRNPDRAWGTRNTVEHLVDALSSVHERFPGARRFVIGDLSWRTGGKITGHRSHRSGRDVDIVFVPGDGGSGRGRKGGRNGAHEGSPNLVGAAAYGTYAGEPAAQDPETGPLQGRRPPQGYRKKLLKRIQSEVLLALIVALSRTHDDPSGVEWIMLDYAVQERLVSYAERHGTDAQLLSRIFQVPHGPAAPVGIVRHYPNHMEHLHVRFKCPPADAYCQNPQKGPASRFDSVR